MIYGVLLHMWDKDGLKFITKCLYNKPIEINLFQHGIEIDLNFSYPTSIPLWIHGKIALDLSVSVEAF